MDNFSVIIAGSRGFKDYQKLKSSCDKILSEKAKTHRIIIISGTASGADSLGERYAEERGYDVIRFPADWEKYGKSAGYRRNAEMARNADALIAFWDGNSRGTRHMIEIAVDAKMPVRIIRFSLKQTEESKQKAVLPKGGLQ